MTVFKKYYFISSWTTLGAVACFLSLFSSAGLGAVLQKPYSHLFSDLISGFLFGGYQYLAMRGLFKNSYLWLLYTICGYMAGFLIGQIEPFGLSNARFLYYISSALIAFAPAVFLRVKFSTSKILLWIFSYFVFLASAPQVYETGVNLFQPKSIFLYTFLHFLPLQYTLGIIFKSLFVRKPAFIRKT